MKKVVILGDTILNNEPLGIQRFAYEILLELDSQETEVEIEMLIPENVECKIKFNYIKIVRYGSYKIPFVWRQIYFPLYVKKNKALAVDLTLGLCVFSKGVTAIFDCIYENCPNDFNTIKEKIKRKSYLFRAKQVIRNSKKIITISKYSKQDIQDYYKVSDNKIEIVYCGWQHYNRVNLDNTILDRLHLKATGYIFSLELVYRIKILNGLLGQPKIIPNINL